jgi:hypothetical protein
MSKKWVDWSDFYEDKEVDYKHTPSALWVNDPSIGVAPKSSDAKPLIKNEKVPNGQSDEEIAALILKGARAPGVRQATDEEMFGHLVVSQEQIDAAEKAFDNKIADFYAAANKPITGQTEVPDEEWGTGKSFNSLLSKSELEKRNMYTGDD